MVRARHHLPHSLVWGRLPEMREPTSDPKTADVTDQNLPPVTPLSLLERARTNNPDAWQRVFQLYRPLVLCWCSRYGVNATDAEDVAQEVFAAASGGLERF